MWIKSWELHNSRYNNRFGWAGGIFKQEVSIFEFVACQGLLWDRSGDWVNWKKAIDCSGNVKWLERGIAFWKRCAVCF